jgi:hypothetical protein
MEPFLLVLCVLLDVDGVCWVVFARLNLSLINRTVDLVEDVEAIEASSYVVVGFV